MIQRKIQTPIGEMIAIASDEALWLLEFADRRGLPGQRKALARLVPDEPREGHNEVLRRVEAQLVEYFAGARREFELPMRMDGSEFQREAWSALLRIPFGETRSYAQQAALLERPEAVRAVARANGENRLAVVVPCHRVVGADGRLTGYGGGLHRKRWLLDHELRHAGAEVLLRA
ncbi:MAG TPA: methylated-DNA--[protein]-cysteine S-methyltransferase [Longimicrobiales bacterium]|nr:methylated-DNA--[protein]-cysteine S-methyltransferase [Longimicrobiales bacterium]